MEKFIGGGVECKVYDTGTGYVRKYYDSNRAADAAYERGVRAYEKGLAPHHYGLDGDSFFQEKVDTHMFVYETELAEFIAELTSTRTINRTYELTEGNYGRTKDGRLVLIDFGSMSAVCFGVNKGD